MDEKRADKVSLKVKTNDSGWPAVDRRGSPTNPLSRFLFRGRRRRIHPADNVTRYVDRPPKEAWLNTILLLCLSVLDARLSLLLFQDARFHELNPLLSVSLANGDWLFLAIKGALSIFSVFILLIHWNFVIFRHQVRVNWILRTLIGLYAFIVVYELLLLSHWI